MTTLGSAHRLQRLYRLQILTIPRQRGSLFMSGNPKSLMRTHYGAVRNSEISRALSPAQVPISLAAQSAFVHHCKSLKEGIRPVVAHMLCMD